MNSPEIWKVKKGQVETLIGADGAIETTFVRKATCPNGHRQTMRSAFETLDGVSHLDVRCVACDRTWPLVLSGLRR
jgi:hypothetical protein